ncbi:uncharacterized protein LOC112685400 [Sipha flava]|uniref:Uncharacterized protein LOC112685400 n=1 Tax=Sipha flava TaxID=143950 RepID=A0A8B8FQN4_9HEMI|nr:uncharacterized protein LOC112685400 [Sipha flava]
MKYLLLALSFVAVRCEPPQDDRLIGLHTWRPDDGSYYDYFWPLLAKIHSKYFGHATDDTGATAADGRSLAVAENAIPTPLAGLDPLEDGTATLIGLKSRETQQQMFGYDPLYVVPSVLDRLPAPSPPKKKNSDPNGKIYKGRITRMSSLADRSTSV